MSDEKKKSDEKEEHPYSLKKVTFEFDGRGQKVMLEGAALVSYIERHAHVGEDLVPLSGEDAWMPNPVTEKLGFLPSAVLNDERVKRIIAASNKPSGESRAGGPPRKS